MDNLIKYLDHGYVKYVDHFGNDKRIAKAARASFVKEEYKSDEMNWSLIDYLFYHQHMSPIEMAALIFESKIPIFVMRQHVRHRMFKLNEQSLRYVTHDGDFYVPDLERMQFQAEDTKQGSGATMPLKLAEAKRNLMIEEFTRQWETYMSLIDEKEVVREGKNVIRAEGLTKELARSVLGTGFYTTVVWQGDLRNLGHYLALRLEGHAQKEIQLHAAIVAEYYKHYFPRTYDALMENVINARHFSKTEVDTLLHLLQNANVTIEDALNAASECGMKASRKQSFINKLGLK